MNISAANDLMLARMYLQSGAYSDAEVYIRRALESGVSDTVDARIMLVEAVWRLGRQSEALSIRTELRTEAIQSHAARLAILDLKLLIEQGHYRQCLDDFGYLLTPEASTIDDLAIISQLAQCHIRLNELPLARNAYSIALVGAKHLQWSEGIARAQVGLAIVNRLEGVWDHAIELLTEAKQTFARLGLFKNYVITTMDLGLQRLWQGELSLAHENLQEASRLASQMGDVRLESTARADSGLALVRQGDLARARVELLRSLRLCRHQASPRRLAIALEYTGELHIAEQRWARATFCLDRALAIANRIAPDGDIVPEVLRRKAEVALGLGQPAEALATAQDAGARATKSGDRYENATALRVVGQALRALGREGEAQASFRTALSTLEELGETFERERIIALLEPGVLTTPRGDKAKKAAIRIDSPQSRDLCKMLAEHGMVGSSRPLQDMMREIAVIAPINIPVLIQGETGSGKELVARALHAIGATRGAQMVAFNCATCPPDLLDAELFGHARGAFTGATAARAGLVRSAEGGSLFLDEIGELREESQARLLRLLDSGEIRPLGSDHSIRVSVRIIAATHVDLKQRVESRRFREDLYFRLVGVSLLVPALRDRPGDVRELVEHFSREARAKIRPQFAGFGEEALCAMENYSWPGNIRQLKMEVLRLVAMAPDGSMIETWTPPDGPVGASVLGQEEATMILQDRDRLQAFVRDLDGQMIDIARRLGVSRGHLYRVLKKTGIRVSDLRPR